MIVYRSSSKKNKTKQTKTWLFVSRMVNQFWVYSPIFLSACIFWGPFPYLDPTIQHLNIGVCLRSQNKICRFISLHCEKIGEGNLSRPFKWENTPTQTTPSFNIHSRSNIVWMVWHSYIGLPWRESIQLGVFTWVSYTILHTFVHLLEANSTSNNFIVFVCPCKVHFIHILCFHPWFQYQTCHIN